LSNSFLQNIKTAGVVGAGGAGFPSYKKLDAKVEIIIANGAECEPLFTKDMTLINHYADEIIKGLLLAKEQVGAKRAIFGIKAKHVDEIEKLTPLLKKANIELHTMDDVYPAGDEYELVYSATDRLIPTGGIPLHIGVVVNNVESLYNMYQASQGIPVTHSLICILGGVKQPKTFWAPIGMSIEEALEVCGGAVFKEFSVIDGGAMMGNIVTDLSAAVTKTSSGYIVLDDEHDLILKKRQSERTYKAIGKSTCDQCSICTEMCPRYLLGQPVQPHLVMRALEFTGPDNRLLNKWAQACCECNICSLYACPEGLDPRNMCVSAKEGNRQDDIAWSPDEAKVLTKEEHPLREYRKVPTDRLMKQLGLYKYKSDRVVFDTNKPSPKTVNILLKQHIGQSCDASVKVGDTVKVGQLIAKISADTLGVPIHASINGTVKNITRKHITLERK
jgi:Na+-translocating ferredoxin:NAD+ oxidoreductase RnfC subunit